jgi:hypothetical protein
MDGAGKQDSYVLLLRTLDVHEHTVESEDALFESTSVVRDLTWLRGCFATGFTLDHDVEVD